MPKFLQWPVVITMKKKLAGTWKKKGYRPVQINGNKFATGQILGKAVEVVKGRILAGWAQKVPKPCTPPVWSVARTHDHHPLPGYAHPPVAGRSIINIIDYVV
jgi:hypothetical protein